MMSQINCKQSIRIEKSGLAVRSKADETLVIVETLICPLQNRFYFNKIDNAKQRFYYSLIYTNCS